MNKSFQELLRGISEVNLDKDAESDDNDYQQNNHKSKESFKQRRSTQRATSSQELRSKSIENLNKKNSKTAVQAY